MTARSKQAVRDGSEPETAFSGRNARNAVRVHVSCRAFSHAWAFRSKFDLGRVFAGLVGESEDRMRKALAVAEGVAPCVLWIDELEKGLAGIGGSGGSGDSGDSGDSGVATRVFGTLLTWMEEKRQPVFVVATANNIAQLPPELLRKGRLDEIFFVDLPMPRTRAEILMIHLGRRQRAPSDYDIGVLARATDGFSGAELEDVVVNALFDAYATPQRQLKTEHLLKAAQEIIPLSRSRAREIEALRQWAATNCRPAASAEATAPSDSVDAIAARRQRMVDV
jgi:SpoVK/Ycf46/Vps4 family AAA+-type ATPase